jgi:hypothetical protein
MSIVHDAYLFKPEEFAIAVIPYIEALKKDQEGYSFVRSSSIKFYGTHPEVKTLVEEYGGWDRNAIITQMPEYYPESPDDIAFWFVLLLYSHLFRTKPHQLGLGSNLYLLDKILAILGWDYRERSLLIKGYSFRHFAQEWLYQRDQSFDNSEDNLEYWNHIHPYSTAGSCGWIDLDNAKRLLDKLNRDQRRLSELQLQEDIRTNSESIQNVYQSAIEMLMTAKEEYCGLCMIISG